MTGLATARTLHRLIVGTLSLALVSTSLASPAWGDPAPPQDWQPDVQEWKPLPAEDVRGDSDNPGGTSDKSVPAIEQVRIEPAAIEVTGEPDEWLQADQTPISVKGVDAAQINVLDDGAVPDSQVALAFEITTDTPDAEVEVDLEALQESGLLTDTDRARLVELPQCYATTPDAPECSKPIAVLAEPTAEKSLAVSGISGATTLMAVAAAESGENGSFAAQPLAPSSTWSTGGSTGEFSWSYPLSVPDLALQGAIAPSVGLSYNSSTVDGRVRTTNNQAGLLGQGWGYEAGFIERRYVTCDSHPVHPKTGEGDLCWAGEALFLNFGDRSAEIVRDDATGVYKLKKDDGTRLEKLTGAPNGALNGEHWKLTTPDGTAYYFGREALPGRTDQALTQSTWTVPVYGVAAGDPCYNASGFESSRCVQAWRWNLDYAEDTYGNAAAYYYNKETNFYAGSARLQYTRGGVPLRIEYGLRNESNSVYGTAAGARVVFDSSERCMPTADFTCDPALFTTNNKGRWPDTPRDLKCEATGTCMVGSPTFWNQRRITKIYTQIKTSEGTWLTRDSYALAHTFPSTVDTSLWLRSITHTSYSTSGAAITRDPVEFTHTMLENRVVGDTMPMMRLYEIRDEVGLLTQVAYTPQDCSPTSLPATGDLSANTRRCFPVKWTTPGASEPSIDFFHKYLVSNIAIFDLAGNSPAQRNAYIYGGTPAWRYDDSELVKAKDRTWGQFRGYEYVDVRTGDPNNNTNGSSDKLNVSRTYYLRGMHGGKTPTGTASVTRQNSLGESISDLDYLAGAAYETQTFLSHNDLANPLTKTLTTYEIKPASATRARSGLTPLTANVVGVTSQRSITAITGGGNLTSTTSYTLDALGRPTAVSTTGTNAPSSCVKTSYAQNATRNILALPAEVLTTAGTCAETGSLLRGARIYYDGSTTLGQVSGPGSATRTDTAVTASEWSRATATYDAAGRITAATAFTSTSDTTGRTVKTSYLPSMGGPLQSVTATNPLGQTAATSYNIDGQSIKESNISGQVTEATYDALGRITAVWEPGFPKSGPATRNYSYTLSRTAPETITTKTTTKIDGTTATQTTSIAIHDAFGQQIQTQTDAIGGGRVMDNTFYDSNGQVSKTWSHWYTTGAPSGTPVLTTESAIDSRTVNLYDGAGRITDAVSYRGTTETRRTKTIYTGNQTLVVPPGGFGITSSVVNALGQTTEKRDYVTAPTISGSTFTGGTYKTTKFTTDAIGQQTSMTDPTGAVWSYTYNLAGHRTKAVDPDTGTTTSTYNHLGEKLTSTDARGTAGTLKYTYDAMGRTTKLVGGVGDKTIATWTYDTLRAGQLTESRSYVNGDTANPYIQKVTGYDTYARPTGSSTVIPASQGTLAGTYTTNLTYTSTGQLATEKLPALGGLPAETLTRTYTAQGQPYSLKGANQYVNSTTYNPLGLLSTRTGHENNSLNKAITYNSETLAVDATALNANALRPQIHHNAYTRNAAGLITKSSTLMNFTNPASIRTMCYRYDTRARLTNAWTSTDGCTANPTSTNKTTGGVVPIWHQWAYNDAGVRTRQIRNKVIELPAATTTTNYTLATTGPKHATASEASVTGSTTTTSNFSYDAAGNTTKTVTGSVTENLTWDAQGKLVTVAKGTKSTSYICDADGNILVRKDPTGTTIYTAAGELRLTGTTTKTGTRLYSHAGETVAQRIGATLQAVDADHLGTGMVAVNWANLSQTTWRVLDPFGNQLGATGTWQTDRTYLDKATDTSTGYVQMGARVYNPKNGRFLSVDPILDPGNANTLNGYSYTAGDPINSSDPSGLYVPRFHQIPESGDLLKDNGKTIPRQDKKEIIERYTRPEPSLKERQEKEIEMYNSTVIGSAISILMIGGVASPWLSDAYDQRAAESFGPYLGNQYNEIRASHELAALIFGLGKVSIGALRSRSIARAMRPHVAPASPTAVRVNIDPKKFDYIFGRVTSNAHNRSRSAGLGQTMDRLGIRDTPEGHALLTEHFEQVARAGNNVSREFTSNYGRFVVKEGLLIGPYGFAKTETTWKVFEDTLQFTTVIVKE